LGIEGESRSSFERVTRKSGNHPSYRADIMGALWDHFGDQQLLVAYRSQLKARAQASGKTLQEFTAAMEQLAH
jgi:hypothetical protein